MSNTRRWTWVIGAGLAGAAFLMAVYLSLVSLAESPQHAVDLLTALGGKVLAVGGWDQRDRTACTWRRPSA